MDAKKQLKAWKRLAETTEGWRVRETKNNHIQFFPPEGPIIVAGSTVSDHRSLKNTRADLKRAGLDV